MFEYNLIFIGKYVLQGKWCILLLLVPLFSLSLRERDSEIYVGDFKPFTCPMLHNAYLQLVFNSFRPLGSKSIPICLTAAEHECNSQALSTLHLFILPINYVYPELTFDYYSERWCRIVSLSRAFTNDHCWKSNHRPLNYSDWVCTPLPARPPAPEGVLL